MHDSASGLIEAIEAMGRQHQLPGEPVDVAGAVVFLASPAALMISGASLLIDGGWTSV